MAKSIRKQKPIITKNSLEFLRNYINNASPVGFESGGQKIWLGYLKPFIDKHFIDPYGTAVGVINPDLKFKVVLHGAGAPIILITTPHPVREPYLNFLVEVKWPNGRMLREFTNDYCQSSGAIGWPKLVHFVSSNLNEAE